MGKLSRETPPPREGEPMGAAQRGDCKTSRITPLNVNIIITLLFAQAMYIYYTERNAPFPLSVGLVRVIFPLGWSTMYDPGVLSYPPIIRLCPSFLFCSRKYVRARSICCSRNCLPLSRLMLNVCIPCYSDLLANWLLIAQMRHFICFP